jgi:hypothetical protein
MQLENDIFDIHKDYQDNVVTLATTTKNIADLKKSISNYIMRFYTF